MITYLLDTDISIYIIKNKPAFLKDLFNRKRGMLAISSISAMELFYGVEKSQAMDKNRKLVDGYLSRLSILDYDTHAAMHTGQIRAELTAAGTPIGPYDAMIAGHARSLGLMVVTNNEREFSRVSGLRIENWVAR